MADPRVDIIRRSLIVETVFKLQVDLPRIGVVRSAEGRAVIKKETPVG